MHINDVLHLLPFSSRRFWVKFQGEACFGKEVIYSLSNVDLVFSIISLLAPKVQNLMSHQFHLLFPFLRKSFGLLKFVFLPMNLTNNIEENIQCWKILSVIGGTIYALMNISAT